MTTVSPRPRTTAATGRTRRIRPLLTEARRGAWIFVPVTLAVLAGPFLELFPGQDPTPGWVPVHNALRSIGLLFGGPFAVAAGFWLGGRERRRGTGELLSSTPVSPLHRTALAATPAVLWPVAAYACSAAFCGVWVSASSGIEYGSPFLGLFAADGVAIGALGLIGFLAGRVIAQILAGPALALAIGLVMFGVVESDVVPVLGDYTETLGWLSPANRHWQPWDAPVWWFAPASALWAAALALAALLAYAGRRRFAAASLALAVAGGGVLVVTGDGLWRQDPRTTALVCSGGTPEVCMVRLHQRYLDDAQHVLSGVTGKLDEIPHAPRRLIEVPTEERGRPVSPAGLPGRNEAPLTEPPVNFDDDTGFYAREAAYRAAVHGCAKTPNQSVTPVPRKYAEAVTAWLAPASEEHVPRSANAVLERIKAMPGAERTAWLGDYFAAVRDCKPERIPAP